MNTGGIHDQSESIGCCRAGKVGMGCSILKNSLEMTTLTLRNAYRYNLIIKAIFLAKFHAGGQSSPPQAGRVGDFFDLKKK